ncbi:MAG: GntR family transcriptional regulator [Acidimicrobiales bacterium]
MGDQSARPASGGVLSRLTGLELNQQERRTAHQLARDTLRRAILSGQIPAGTRLVQSDIAQRLMVSTTPVREALRDLATEGLIRLDAHRGAIVRKLDADELEELYRVRQLLEPEIIRLAVERMTDEELDAAEAIQDRADEEQNLAVWADFNRQFHSAFIAAARSPRLASIVHNLLDSATVYIAASLMYDEHRREEGNAQHRQLLDAVRRRDADTAVDVMLTHIRQTVESVSDAVGGHGQP